MNAAELVSILLEADHDAHVKAHKRIKAYDGAVKTFDELIGLKKKQADTFAQMGTALGYERALAYAGLTRADVSRPIYGDTIGATDNFKGKEPAYKCRNPHCNSIGKYDYRPRTPGDETNCANCGEPKEQVVVPIPPLRLLTRYPQHIFGVVTNDGRRVWFDEPVRPKSAFM